MQPQAFVQKWRAVQVKEKSGYQEHFFDLCALLGAKTPIYEDPKGTFAAWIMRDEILFSMGAILAIITYEDVKVL